MLPNQGQLVSHHRGLAGWSTGPWHLHQLTGCPRPAFLFPGKGGPSLIAASPPPRPHLPGATCPPLHGFQQQLRHAMCTLFSDNLLVFLKRYRISLSRPYFVSKTQADSPSHNLHARSSDYLFLPANEVAGMRAVVKCGASASDASARSTTLDQYNTDGRIQKEPISLIYLGFSTAIGPPCSALNPHPNPNPHPKFSRGAGRDVFGPPARNVRNEEERRGLNPAPFAAHSSIHSFQFDECRCSKQRLHCSGTR